MPRIPKPTPGIVIRHRGSCEAHDGGRCRCEPGFLAWVYSAEDGRKIKKTFPTMAAAKAWRRDALSAVSQGRLRAPTESTLADAAEDLIVGMRTGAILNRSGDVYKPSVVRSYEQALRLHALPRLGGRKLTDISRADLEALAEHLRVSRDPQTGKVLDPSTVRNAFLPLRVIYRRAVARGQVAVNPTLGLGLAAVRGRRDRVATPAEAAALLAALPAGDRPVWATAFYGGLRLGELRALRCLDVDFDGAVIRVERSWDQYEGVVEPKSLAGRRTVPLAATLRGYLHPLAGQGADLAFGRTRAAPFNPATLYSRARRAWIGDGLEPITLHEARHTFASLMIAAGVQAKELSVYMGHSGIAITLDRYGHLFPGTHSTAAGMLDAYLARADTASRLAPLDP